VIKKIIISVSLLLVLIFTGCSDNNGNFEVVEVNQENIAFNEQDVSNKNVDSLNDYSFQMAKELSSNYVGSNFVVSPLSLWMPLAALSNATTETAVENHLSSLRFESRSIDEINLFAAQLLYELNNEECKEISEENGVEFIDSLYIANALFLNNEYEAKQDFVDSFYNYYKGTTMLVDFSSNDAKNRVNEWVYNRTEGNIKNIVDDFDPYTVAALANTIFFKGTWEKEFYEEANQMRLFYNDNSNMETEFMVMDGESNHFVQSYFEDDSIQAVDFPYTNDAGMIIILPKIKKAIDVFSELNVKYFNKINNESKMLSGKTYLPKFKIESDTMNLMKVMESMQEPLISGYIDGLDYSQNDLYISDAYQKAMIEVNEEGTTAAAATIVEVMETAIEPSGGDTFVMDCNKPFIFILYGDINNYKQILFTGIVMNP